jgi:hypothetical protein
MSGLAPSNHGQTILYVRGGKPIAFQNTDPELTKPEVLAMMGLPKDMKILVQQLDLSTSGTDLIPGYVYGIRKERGGVVLTENEDL